MKIVTIWIISIFPPRCCCCCCCCRGECRPWSINLFSKFNFWLFPLISQTKTWGTNVTLDNLYSLNSDIAACSIPHYIKLCLSHAGIKPNWQILKYRNNKLPKTFLPGQKYSSSLVWSCFWFVRSLMMAEAGYCQNWRERPELVQFGQLNHRNYINWVCQNIQQ